MSRIPDGDDPPEADFTFEIGIMKSIYFLTAVVLGTFCFGGSCSKGVSKNANNEDTTATPSDTVPQSHHYSTDYKWGQLPIGGGGYVTGIIIHPEAKNIIYIRTDVGGAYRWDMKDQVWVQMLDWVGPEEVNLVGVDGMAIDPNDPDRIYLAMGKDIDGQGGVYRSEDKGKTWTKLMDAKYAGNGRVDRWTGECIAVDPNNSEVIYAGTRTNGIWRSTDDGSSWSKVVDIPDGFTGNNPIGIRTVVFDPAVKSGDRSSIIYVGVPETGIYKSGDGGASFSLMPGSPKHPNRMQVVDRKLFVTHATGVSLWSKGQWRDITPSNGKNKNYVGLAVNKLNDNKIVVAQRYGSFYNPVYRSEDQGDNWEQINSATALHVTVPWWNKKRFSSATSAMAFIPGSEEELYYTDWFGVWYTADVWKATTDWHTVEDGHEETVVVTLVAPPKGALVYSGMADNFGFKHTTLNAYPDKRLYELNEGFSIAVCEKYPANIAVLGAKSWGGDHTLLATSSDYGETWTDRALPASSTLGRIAISATNPDHMVYVAGGGSVYYSKNAGASWTTSQGAPAGTIQKTDIWNKEFVLAADRVAGNIFYLLDRGSGTFYASSDEGATWQARSSSNLPGNLPRVVNVVPVPGSRAAVWISCDDKGLWKTSDGGETFNRIYSFDVARFFSWGAPASKNTFPTAYCYGRLGGEWGLYRSTDMGESWVRINDNENQFLGHVSAIAADRKTFGQIYIGTGGNGIFYGQLIN